MSGLKQWMINHRLNRLFVTCLLSLLMILNVACSAPKLSKVNPNETYNQGSQEIKGGVNQLDKNDLKVQAKTRELINTAKKNAANPDKLEDLSEQARQSTEAIPGQIADRIKNQKDSFVKGTERGVQNLKENLKEASKEIPNVVKEATDGAMEKVK